MSVADNIILTDEFKDALALLEADFAIQPVIFITGRAGTGKTTLLRYFAEHSAQQKVILAPTGLAALNVRGQTIHSFFWLTPSDNLLDPNALKKLPRHFLKNIDTIVIDEASMLRADLFDAMDHILRISTKDKRPFGGKKIVLFGDLFQLPPVEERQEDGLFNYFYEKYNSPYFFDAHVLREVPLEVFELKRIFRQQQDVPFMHLLNHIREGSVTQAELDERLNTHIMQQAPEQLENGIILAPTNQNVARRNQRYLDSLPGQEFVYPAKASKTFSKVMPAEGELRLKKGAKIMMLVNDNKEHRWVNGDIGVVHDLGEDFIAVQLKGQIFDVRPHKWEHIRYEYDPLSQKLEPQVKGSFTQYPLKLAWAITIHKSQGLTFENIFLDMGRGAFATGQTYVALSRCRTLNGVHLQRDIEVCDVLCDKRVQQFFRSVYGDEKN